MAFKFEKHKTAAVIIDSSHEKLQTDQAVFKASDFKSLHGLMWYCGDAISINTINISCSLNLQVYINKRHGTCDQKHVKDRKGKIIRVKGPGQIFKKHVML